ncbi:hypothetical protein DFH09DRAFT_1081432 [Mycena vulgaris]|nr:hypothetical protein DFH09DRAFT_1081432 [Mycena vulgaris]
MSPILSVTPLDIRVSTGDAHINAFPRQHQCITLVAPTRSRRAPFKFNLKLATTQPSTLDKHVIGVFGGKTPPNIKTSLLFTTTTTQFKVQESPEPEPKIGFGVRVRVLPLERVSGCFAMIPPGSLQNGSFWYHNNSTTAMFKFSSEAREVVLSLGKIFRFGKSPNLNRSSSSAFGEKYPEPELNRTFPSLLWSQHPPPPMSFRHGSATASAHQWHSPALASLSASITLFSQICFKLSATGSERDSCFLQEHQPTVPLGSSACTRLEWVHSARAGILGSSEARLDRAAGSNRAARARYNVVIRSSGSIQNARLNHGRSIVAEPDSLREGVYLLACDALPTARTGDLHAQKVFPDAIGRNSTTLLLVLRSSL